MEYFGANLRTLRKSNNISQVEMTKSLDIERTRLSNWENGTSYPNVEVLVKIAKYFDISIDDLLFKNLENVGNEDISNKKTGLKNVGDNVGNVIGNKGKKEENDENDRDFKIFNEKEQKTTDYEAKYVALLEEFNALAKKYTGVLEGKLIEHDFQYRLVDIDARVKALQELVINENLQDLPLPSQKEAFFHKKKQDMILQSGILSGEST